MIGKKTNSIYMIILLVLTFVLTAWVRPEVPTKAVPTTTPDRELDQFEIEVNGELRSVRPGEELNIIRGDKIRVVSARLKLAGEEIDLVNVVGYKNLGGKPGEDRGFEVNTGTDMIRSWSENGADKVYAIIAETMGEMHGLVYLTLDAPALVYAELLLNSEKLKIENGTKLKVKASDSIKVTSVVTNVKDNEGVRFLIVNSDSPDTGSSSVVVDKEKSYEIRFVRAGFVFARISMQVEN